MRKSQSALEFLFTYGWAVLLLVLAGIFLFKAGIFNFDQSATVVSELSSFQVDDALLASDGELFLDLGVKTGQTLRINNIDYIIEGDDCLNSLDESDFSIPASGTILINLSADSSCSLHEGVVAYINVTIDYATKSGLEHSSHGRIRILVQPRIISLGNYTWFMGSESSFGEGNYLNTTWGSVMLSKNNITGIYISKVFDAGSAAVWRSLSWSENFTYNWYSSLNGDIGWWRMDENYWNGSSNEVKDSSGNNYHLTSYGNSNTTGNALFGRAGILDGNGDYMQKTTNSLQSATWSVEAWLKRRDFDTISPIANYDVHYSLEVYNNHLRIGRDFGEGYGWNYAEGASNVAQNEWVHAVGLWNGSSLKIYYNGRLESENSSSSGLVVMQFNPPFYIGRKLPYYFNGTIDEVAVYNRALTESEILEHYNHGLMSLNARVRSCDDSACSGENWSASYSNSSYNLLPESNSRYFQFMFNFTSGNETNTPRLYNVSINYEII